MPKILSINTLKYIGAAIVLGAIGSGVWEWVLKPAVAQTSKLGLDIATLGIQSLKDSLYRDVAQGLHEGPSVRIYFALYGLLPMSIFGFALGFITAGRRASSGREPGVLERTIDRTWRPLVYFMLFVLVYSAINANKVAYVNRAITHFNQLVSVVSPYVSSREMEMLESEFAQISSSQDYYVVIKKLREECANNSLKCPEFSVW
jgi:hypothetical protein